MPGTVWGMNAIASSNDFPRTRLRTTNQETTAESNIVTAGTTRINRSEFRSPCMNSVRPAPNRIQRYASSVANPHAPGVGAW